MCGVRSKMGIFHIVVLGVLQGVTELLAISSSAHLILYSALLAHEELPLLLNLAFHSGTLLSLLIYFGRDWRALIQQELLVRRRPQLTLQLLVASVPIAVVGLLGQAIIARYLHHAAVVIIPLALAGIALWWCDRRCPQTRSISTMSLRHALAIGAWQVLALVPGVSRSGITMLGGRMLGLTRQESVKFAFLLGTPVMAGALLLNYRSLLTFLAEPRFLIGVLVSAVTGLLVIKLLLHWVDRIGFGAFAVYRLVLAALLTLWLLNNGS